MDIYDIQQECNFSNFEINFKTGLNDKSVEKSAEIFGTNALPKKKLSFWKRYIKPMLNPMLEILFFCALALMIFDSVASGLQLIFIVVLNALISIFQQFRAQKTLETLKNLSAQQSKVIRNGSIQKVFSDEIVVGDILSLETGDFIGADGVVVENTNFAVNESSLTGESDPVQKKKYHNTTELNVLNGYNPKCDSIYIVSRGTYVASGNARVLVTSIGTNTKIGNIAKHLKNMDETEIPLQVKVIELAKTIGKVVLLLCVVLFIFGLIQKVALGITITLPVIFDLLSWLVVMAMTGIPYMFPLIITIILYTGLFQLAKKKAIVTNLSAVESLGRISVICSDKTGTLTKNEMTVKNIFIDNHEYRVSGVGYNTVGTIYNSERDMKLNSNEFFDLLMLNCVLNNNASIVSEKTYDSHGKEQGSKIKAIGSPTEGSLLCLGEKYGLNKELLEEEYLFLDEISFTSKRKMMTTIREKSGNQYYFTKGAPEKILSICSNSIDGGKITPLDYVLRQTMMDKIEAYAKEGYRVLGFSFKGEENNSDYKMTPNSDKKLDFIPEEIEKDQTFLGFCAIQDSPRESITDAIKECRKAGVNVVMITGDHDITAESIGMQIGLIDRNLGPTEKNNLICIGNQINDLSNEEIRQKKIFSRTSPIDKLKIVEAFQENGQIVAMTGDGVNDALALEKANAGIAMGITGTDVAKSAADLIITDDSFVTITEAIYHGRGLFNNIRANLWFYLTIDLLEVAVLSTVFLLFQGTQIFNEIQLTVFLWNFIHTIPPLALMFDSYNREKLMNLPPKDPDEAIISKELVILLIVQIVSVTLVVLGLYFLCINETGVFAINEVNLGAQEEFIIDGESVLFSNLSHSEIVFMKTATVCLLTISFSEAWVALNVRADLKSIFNSNFSILFMIMISLTISFILIAFNTNFGQKYFLLIPLSPMEWILCIGLSLSTIIFTELVKRTIRNKEKRLKRKIRFNRKNLKNIPRFA